MLASPSVRPATDAECLVVSATRVDPFVLVHEAVLAAGHANDLGDQLRALAAAPAALAGGPTTVVVRDESLAATLVVQVRGERVEPAAAPQLVPGPVWRRWLRLLQARRAQLAAPGASGAVYALDLADAWARDEFGAALCGGADAAGLLVAPIVARDGAVLATLVQEIPETWPPSVELVRAVEIVAQQVGHHVAEGRLAALAGRRAERLQRLQEAGAALARSLDEGEIVRELARQVGRLVAVDGIVIAQPDLEAGVVRTALRLVHGLSRPRADQPLGAGPIAEAARTGAIVRVDDYAPAYSVLAAHDDVVGDAGPAGSVLAAPMRVGTQLVGVVAVHAAAPRAFRAEEEELLRAVAAQAGTAIANARRYAESEAERRQTEALAEVARAVGGSLRPGEVLRLILRHTTALLKAGGACVALQRDDYLHVVAGVGAASLLSGVHVPTSSSLMGRALRERRPFISNVVSADEDFYKPVGRVAAVEKAVLVPLVSAAGPIGVIVAINREADFTDADARVLQRLADHVAVAIANARLFEEVTTATREWKAALDALSAGLVVLDEQGRVRRCNQRAAELCGVIGPKALLGADFREILGLPTVTPGLAPSTIDPADLDVVDRARALGEVARETVHAPAREAWLDVVAAPHPDGGTVLTFDDVTADRARAAALARSEARYERLVESATDAIFTADVEGRLTSVNHAIERATGRPRADLLGAPWEALVVGGAARDVARETTAEVLAAALRGERVRREVSTTDADGESHTYSLVAAPIVEDDAVSGVLGIMRDVTDERRLADQLAQRERLAAVGRLVRGIAHELNNPLASVVALADLLSGDAPDAGDVQDAALAIRAEARRAARIVGRLHAFAQHRAPERASTDVNRVVLDVLDLRRYALRMQDVDVVVDLDYELQPTWADPLQLQQVFVQLVATVEESLASVAPERRRLVARTRRRGDVVEAAFVGAWIGADRDAELAVSAEIVRAHGGRIRVDRGDDGGALVVELPLVAPPALGIRDTDDA